MSHFWRNVISVFSGTLVAQIIPILGSLVIAREYVPAQFGIYVAWFGLVAIAAVMVTGRFETSFAISPDGEPRRMAVVCTLATMLLTMILLGLVTAFFYFVRPVWLKVTNPYLFVLFVPAVMFAATAQIWQVWAATEGKYRQLSIMRICQAVAVVTIQITTGYFFPSAVSLAGGYTLGLMAGLCACFYILPLGKLPPDIVVLTRQFWSRYTKFPLYALPADAINTIAGQLPVLVIASRFGPTVTGLLALTMRTLGGPISLLGASVLDVFKRHAAISFLRRGECRADYVRTFWALLGGAICMVIVLLPGSEFLFTFAFGEKWKMAGTMAIWLLPMFAMRFIASPLSYMVYIAEKQQVDLIWQIGLLAMTVFTLNLPASYPVVLESYAAGYATLYVIYLAMSYRFSLGESR